MRMEEFDAQVACPGDQPSCSRGGWASTAQEPVTEEPPAPAPSSAVAEEETTPTQTPQPSPPPAPALEEI